MALMRVVAAVAVLAASVCYPWLPGAHDPLAASLSSLAQVLGVAGLLFVPVGVWWRRTQGRHEPAHGEGPRRTRLLVIGTLRGVGLLVCAVLALVAFASSGLALALAVLPAAAWAWRAAGRIATNGPAGRRRAGALIVVPILVLVLQQAPAWPLTLASRNRAIAHARVLIDEIERFHSAHGGYPASLAAVWPDYRTGVVGIAQYHYVVHDTGFTLYFEQPLPLFGPLGTREFVAYHPRGAQLVLSHASWHLTRPPATSTDRQGWYAARDTLHAGWRRFLFD